MKPSARKSDIYDNPASQRRYEAFAKLQATAVSLGEALDIPEIVAIGGQSDGKSSLLEAFLGFRFNVTASEMGTRRPLIVQMIHDLTAQEPRCSLQEEDSTSYGEMLQPDAISDAIRERTEAHLRDIRAAVSSKPIIMRAEYAFSPNLTIIDTPGLVLNAQKGESESTPHQIIQMVKEQCAPKHRLILFLQQSSVEWASTLWTHIIQELDPGFSRTIFVCSKFDNRLAELSERWELEKYLSAAGYLPPNVRPFFVALPKDKSNIGTSADWRDAIQSVDGQISHRLHNEIKGGFDEERFRSQIGFCNLRRYLEEELATRYRDAAPATLALLQDRCAMMFSKLENAERTLERMGDVKLLRHDAIRYTLSLAASFNAIMDGFGGADPQRHGMTSEEQKPSFIVRQNTFEALKNSKLRLFGGAAVNRAIYEMQILIKEVKFPIASRDAIANMLLAAHGETNSAMNAIRAAEELARSSAQAALAPILDIAASRLMEIVCHSYDIACQMESASAGQAITSYVAFQAHLLTSFRRFVTSLQAEAKCLLRQQLNSITSRFSMAMFSDQIAQDADNASRAKRKDGKSPLKNLQAGNAERTQQKTSIQNCDKDGKNGTENSPPTICLGSVDHRPLFNETVPETPSPDIPIEKNDCEVVLGTKHHRNHRLAVTSRHGELDSTPSRTSRGTKIRRLSDINSPLPDDICCDKERSTDELHGETEYSRVHEHSKLLFEAVKEVIATQTTPVTLKTSILEPLQTQLPVELCVKTVGLSDSEFLHMFATETTINLLQGEREELKRRYDGLKQMTDEFNELAQTL